MAAWEGEAFFGYESIEWALTMEENFRDVDSESGTYRCCQEGYEICSMFFIDNERGNQCYGGCCYRRTEHGNKLECLREKRCSKVEEEVGDEGVEGVNEIHSIGIGIGIRPLLRCGGGGGI